MTSVWQTEVTARRALPGDLTVDVAIVGAGYTGLWTAYYLATHDPSLRIAVIEREVAGFGASGRNGGWCSALFPTSWNRMARGSTRESVVSMQRALEASVVEVGATGIDCDFVQGGMVGLARGEAQLVRARQEVAHARQWGFGADTLALLDAPAALARVNATRVLGAVATQHCAALHPWKLVRGLADAVEDLGVQVFEGTSALSVKPGVVTTTHGTVRAEVVLPATEGYPLPGHKRDLAPIYSLMLATEPLPDEVWEQIGLHDRATFADERHLTIYGQRTADGRIAFGGRGAPYHFGSRVSPAYDVVERVHTALQEILVDLFPVLHDATITHRWGGNLGVPRDWFPSVGFDRRSGMAWAGGYVGDGVATSNLAGRTVADLVLERDTELVGLPWVRKRTKKWEPEPLRWIGVNAVTQLMARADRTEESSGRPSRAAATFWRALGH